MASGRGLPAGRKHPWMTKHPGCLQRLIMRFAVHAAWSSPAGTHPHNVGACSGQGREGPGVLRGTLAPRIHTVARRTAYLCSRMPCRLRHRLQQQPLIQQLPPQSTGLAPWYRETSASRQGYRQDLSVLCRCAAYSCPPFLLCESPFTFSCISLFPSRGPAASGRARHPRQVFPCPSAVPAHSGLSDNCR